MTKVKVLDLAREVGMEDDKLLMKLKRMGVKMKDKKVEEPEKAAASFTYKAIFSDERGYFSESSVSLCSP